MKRILRFFLSSPPILPAAALVLSAFLLSCATSAGASYEPPIHPSMRLALAQISQETNSFSPVLTTLAEFDADGLYYGGEILSRYAGTKTAIGGFMAAVAEHGKGEVEIVPILKANAVSGGALEREVYERFRGELASGLAAAMEEGPLDGVYLVTHGAMGVDGLRDPEGDLLQTVRALVGSDLPIVISHDLHANITARRAELATAIVGYKTNPHRDFFETGYTSGSILVRTVLGEIRPVMSVKKMRLLSGGGMGIDFLAPMNGIFAWMKRVKRDPAVLDVSNFMVHIWLDDPELGWTTVAITDGDPELADRLSTELADHDWAARTVAIPERLSAEEAVARVRRSGLARAMGTVVICDASDAVGAGAPGENTWLLKAFLDNAPELRTYIPVRDPEAVAEVWGRSVGAEVSLPVGGRLETEYNRPVEFTGTIEYLDETDYGKTAILAHGGIRLILTEIAATASSPSFFTELGLSLWKADAVVVKNLFPFRYNYILYNRKTLDVATPGTTDVNCLNLRYGSLPRPIYPYDDIPAWR